MGHLYYGNSESPIEVPDRLLAHLKVVVATKLRRGESFTVSWRHPADAPRGRSTLWMHPSIPLRFVFDTSDPEMLDRDYLQKLALSASSTGGMSLDMSDLPERSEPDALSNAPIVPASAARARVPAVRRDLADVV